MKINKHQRQVELVDKAMPYLMELSDICLETMGGMSINVNGGHFEYVPDKPEPKDLLAKGQGECPRCHNGKLVKGICSQCGWIQGQISPIVKPKKEQGEELCSHGREKWACLWPHKQQKKEQGCKPIENNRCLCDECTHINSDDYTSTPPLKEDIKEIEKITLGLKESFDPSAETRTLVLMRFGDKINQLIDAINHLSSKEK
jgi:hypothetical protein